MSSDIEDGCLGTSWTAPASAGAFSLGLVAVCGVEGEFGDQFAVGGDDADVCFADEHADGLSGVAAAEADVVQDACVAQGWA